jgi:hypothetical protein
LKVYIFLIEDFLNQNPEHLLTKILDGNGLKAMPGLILAPNSGSFIEK